MPRDITRYIRRSVERELWARAAGRCQFEGCNRLVYKSPVTQEPVNISEKAHIYSFSKDGPRGWGPFKKKPAALNATANLMLTCHDCHCKIDKEKDGGRYPAALLLKMKDAHERRVHLVTGVDPSKESHVILYGANIGDEKSPMQPEHAKWALFPKWYPSEEHPVELSMSWEGKDDDPAYWATEDANLIRSFDTKVRPHIGNTGHFSIFAFAPMPLLNRHPQYSSITDAWPISNQEGYALWFESRMRQAQQLLESRAAMEKVAKVDDLPTYRWKTPLQRCIQILKRHRDMMFENDQDGKPISAIITTLAARAYRGESDVEVALGAILERMADLVNPSEPWVPNPVNPQEDFADKWPLDPVLEPNFWRWLKKAKEDYGRLGRSDDLELLTETALRKFGAHLDTAKLRKAGGLAARAGAIAAGTAHTSTTGTIGASGTKNQPHRFHG